MKHSPHAASDTPAGDGAPHGLDDHGQPGGLEAGGAEIDGGKFAREVAGAASSMLVLGLIAQAREPTHGYEIARQISQSAPAGFAIKHGTLYPLLRSLEQEGLIQSATMPSSEGPPRRVLWVTDKGRLALQAWQASWRGVQAWVAVLLKPSAAVDPQTISTSDAHTPAADGATS